MKASAIKIAIALLLLGVTMRANEFVVEIVNYNSDTGAFTLKTYGEKPAGATSEFWNDYGVVTGNRYNQIAGNSNGKKATLDLYNWGGCTIDSITINAASNKAAGNIQLMLTTTDDNNNTETLYNSGVMAFNSTNWYGEWVWVNAGVYVDVTKEMTTKRPIADNEMASVIVTAGTQSGQSVYLNRITLYYTPSVGVETESPMPYKFTQLLKTDVLNEGDVCIIATTSHYGASDTVSNSNTAYMQAVPIDDFNEIWIPENSYPELMFFTMHKTADNHWNMINQYGDSLSAYGAKKVSWNRGVTTWDITLGASYDGTTIASTKSSYGSIKYNASDPRFTTYTSGQTKVFLYRKGDQKQPVQPTSVTIDDVRTLNTCTDTLILKPTILPKTTTDTRLAWKSLNESVASVKDGIVRPVGEGTTKIVVISISDDEITDTCELTVTACSAGEIEIELSRTSLELHTCDAGATALTATVLPTSLDDRTVTWSSSNTTVATVSADGKVTPVSEGTAIVTATSNANASVKATCNVTVANCNITSIALKYPDTDAAFTLRDCGGITEGEGERFSVWVEFTPTTTDDEVIWSSSNESVATVTKAVDSYAIVKAIAEGTAIITAASKANSSIKVTSTVTVTACSVSTTYYLTVRSADATMGIVQGEGAYTKNATATIRATATDGYKFSYWLNQDNGKFYANPLNVTMSGNLTYTAYFERQNSSVEDVYAAPLKIYGTSDAIVVENGGNANVTIYDVMGRRLYADKVAERVQFPTKEGIYMVRVDNKVVKVMVR